MYFYTAAPSMLMLDSARFIAGMTTLGISNPAYPLLMLLGNLFTNLPFGSVIFRIQVLMSLFALGTLFLVFLITKILTKMIAPSLFAVLSLAFTYQFWSQALYVEAFIVVSFFTALVVYLIFLPFSGKAGFIKRATLISLLMGIGGGTNPVLVSVVPSILAFFSRNLDKFNPRRLIGVALIGIVALVLVFSYIPLRARQHPFLNWHNPQSISAVWKLATGGGLNVYEPELDRVNGFTGSGKVFVQSSIYYFTSALQNFPFYIMPFALAGIYYLWKEKRRWELTVLGLIAGTNFMMAGLYKSGNQENWFLVSYVAFAVLCGAGYSHAATLFKRIRDGKYLAWAFFLLFLISVATLFPTLNRRSFYLTDDYVSNLYRGVESSEEKGAIIFGSGDYYDAHSFFAHSVARPKPNVTPVTDNNLYIEDWYRENLEKSAGLKVPKKEDYKFDSEADYSKFVSDFFDINLDTHNVYVTQVALRNRLFPGYSGKGSLKIDKERFKLVPSGMLMRVVRKDENIDPNLSSFDFQFKTAGFPGKRPAFVEKSYQKELIGVINEYAFSYAAIGEYFSVREKKEEAEKYMKLAAEFNPGNPEIIENYKKIQAGEKLEEATGSAMEKITPPPGYGEYQNQRLNLSFLLPVRWWGEEKDGVVHINSEDPGFKLEFKILYKDENVSEYDYYVNYKEGLEGTMANSGPARIPGYEDKSYVKVWSKTPEGGNPSVQKQGVQHLQFFVFGENNRVLHIVVGPSTHRFMRNFETIVGSIRF